MPGGLGWGERREDRSRARSPSQVPEPPRPGPPAAMAVHLSQARLLPADWAARGGCRRAPGRTDARPALSGGGRRGAGSACPVTDPGCHAPSLAPCPRSDAGRVGQGHRTGVFHFRSLKYIFTGKFSFTK